MVIEGTTRYIVARLRNEKISRLSLKELDHFLESETIKSPTIEDQLIAVSEVLHSRGEQVVITKLENLQAALINSSVLWIGDKEIPFVI
jgi:carbamate kinase